MLYSKKLKIKYVFNALVVTLFIFSVLRTYVSIKKYSFIKSDGKDMGLITNINKKENYIILNIKGKTNYIAYLKDNKNIKIGDRITFEYEIYNINTFKIPNTFNYHNYLKSKKVKAVIKINNFKKIGKSKLYNIKSKINNIIQHKKSKKYIYTFLFSDKKELDQEIKDSYITNGISHHLCVSGFHVVLLLTCLKNILSKIFRSERFILLILIMISFVYLFLTDYSVALTRASLLYFFVYFNNRLNLDLNKRIIFLITLIIPLFINPYVIYNIGFWYSFVLSYFLLIYARKYNGLLKINMFSFIISMPITIFVNYKINLLSFIYSTIYFYIICFIMYPLSFLALIFKHFDFILYKVSKSVEMTILKLSNINLFQVIIPKVNLLIIIAFYMTIILYLENKSFKYILVYILLIFYSCNKVYFDKNTYIYFLDVHQGDMSLIISKKHSNITVIDTGGIKDNKYLSKSIITFFHSLGITKINTLILSHGDYDHMGEAINLVNNFKLEKVIFNCGEYNDLEKELIKVLNKKKIPYYSCIKKLNINNNKLYFLQTKEYNNENDNSNVIYAKINGYKFMFMGDAGVEKEKDILKKYNISNIDVLKVGHHGSKTSSSELFINRMNSVYSIISVGKNNRYGHPNKEVLNILDKSKIYRTDEDGSITIKIKDKLYIE